MSMVLASNPEAVIPQLLVLALVLLAAWVYAREVTR
jgi:hypothetical protein